MEYAIMRFFFILHILSLVQCEENKKKIETKKAIEQKKLVNLQIEDKEQLAKCMDEFRAYLEELGEWKHNNTEPANSTPNKKPCPFQMICAKRILACIALHIFSTHFPESSGDDHPIVSPPPNEDVTPPTEENTPPSTEENTTPPSIEKPSSAVVPSTKKELLFVSTTRCIVLLADLMVAATSKDFKLIASEPLVLIKYPDSFQATVVQTTNRGYDSFNEAQKSMARLVQLAERAIVLASEGLNVIANGEPSDIQDLLPITLDEIVNAVDKCIEITTPVVGMYGDLLQLTREILKCAGPSVDTQRLLLDTARETDAVREQWVYLATFFTTIMKTVKGSLSGTIDEFTKIIQQEKAESMDYEYEGGNRTEKEDAAGESSTVNESLDSSVGAGDGEEDANENENEELDKSIVESANVKEKKGLLVKDIEQILEVAKKIREVAAIYSEISQRYLIKCILSLNSLAALNPTKDAAAIEGLHKEIMQDCLLADQAISHRKI